jgi:putative hydrolase of the HAD superfamily
MRGIPRAAADSLTNAIQSGTLRVAGKFHAAGGMRLFGRLAGRQGSHTIDTVPEDTASTDLPDIQSEPGSAAVPRIRGVIVDWGGVMTSPILDTMNAWIAAERIDRDTYVTVMRRWVVQAYAEGFGGNPIHALERGECTDEEFERVLAAELKDVDGQPVPADGLLGRMFAAGVIQAEMVELVRSARRAGLRTALLSNSWGTSGFAYPRDLLGELFDVVVISAEVSMRKPEERIFRHTAALLGLDPQECIFIDDVEANVTAAQAVGLTAWHHRDSAATLAHLADLLGSALAQEP